MAITPGTRVIKRATDASTDAQSITVTAGQALLVAVWSNAYFLGTLATVSSVVQDPSGANLAFTAVASQAEWNASERRLSLYVLEAPAVGTFDIRYTLSTAQARSEIMVWPISGQDVSAIVRASATTQIPTPSSTELPNTVASASGDLVFFFGSARTDAYLVVAGDLSNFSSDGVSAYCVFSGTKPGAAGTVTGTPVYNDGTDYSNALIAVSIKAGAAPAPILTGNITEADDAPTGSIAPAAPSSLTGSITEDDDLPTGNLGAVAGTINIGPWKSDVGMPLPSTTIPKLTFLRDSDGLQVLTLLNQVTSASPTAPTIPVTNGALVPGLKYWVASWDAAGVNYGFEPYTAA